MRPLSDPLIVAGSLFGIRIDVARARVARQHVSNPDLLRLERLLVHPSVAPSQPNLIKAHGFILALGAFAGLRREARKIILARLRTVPSQSFTVAVLAISGGAALKASLISASLSDVALLAAGAPIVCPDAASLGDSNSRMLMAPVDGFLSHGPDCGDAPGPCHRTWRPDRGPRGCASAPRLSWRCTDGSAKMSALLELDDIHAAYGLSRVLFGISLEVRKTGFPRRIACGACFSGS